MQARVFAAIMVVQAGVVAIGGCSRTDNGDIVVKRPTQITVKTTPDTVRLPSLKQKTETVNAPIVGTQKETVIVDKPTVTGTQKKVIKVPTIQQP
jgi:hypothetical protein